MKIQILKGVVIDGGKTTKPGDKVEVAEKLALHLIRSGKAKAASVRKRKKKDDTQTDLS